MGIEHHSCKTSIGVLTDFKSFKVKSACFKRVRTRAPLGYKVVMMICFLHFIPKAWYQHQSHYCSPQMWKCWQLMIFCNHKPYRILLSLTITKLLWLIHLWILLSTGSLLWPIKTAIHKFRRTIYHCLRLSKLHI